MSRGTYSDKIKLSHFNSLYIRVNVDHRQIYIRMLLQQLCHLGCQDFARLAPLGVEVHYNCIIRIDDLERMQYAVKIISAISRSCTTYFLVKIEVVFDNESLGTARWQRKRLPQHRLGDERCGSANHSQHDDFCCLIECDDDEMNFTKCCQRTRWTRYEARATRL